GGEPPGTRGPPAAAPESAGPPRSDAGRRSGRAPSDRPDGGPAAGAPDRAARPGTLWFRRARYRGPRGRWLLLPGRRRRRPRRGRRAVRAGCRRGRSGECGTWRTLLQGGVEDFGETRRVYGETGAAGT